MAAYIFRRALQSIALIFVVASLVAIFIQFLPGDPAYTILGENNATPERVAAVREELGLDRPILIQYKDWVVGVFQGDLGTSLTSKRPVANDLAQRLPRTFELIAASTMLATIVGVTAGVVAASHHNRWPDVIVSLLSLIWISTPVFVSGTLLLLLFGMKLKLLPVTGYVGLTDDPLGHLQRLALPALTLALLDAAVILRMTRSSLLEVLGEDYVRTARAKGVSNRTVLYGHALRNALIPVVTVIGLQMGTLLGGAVLVEYIFNWPGVSSYLIAGIGQRDYVVVQAVVLVIATLFIILNFVTDLIFAVLDPRIKYA